MELECPMSLLERETRLRSGRVPQGIGGEVGPTNGWQITPDAFLLRAENGLAFHYSRGEGVVFERGEGTSEATVSLYFNGSVHGAIAWMNGFVPLHASAICHNHKVYAFTGDSGAGKSTLVAGLAGQEMPLFADDVLIMDIRDPEQIRCLPGHKSLKLWSDAAMLVGIERREQVFPDMDKYYVEPLPQGPDEILPLALLCYLERDGRPYLSKMTASERFSCLSTALYRPEFTAGAGIGNVELFRIRKILAKSIPMSRFLRPFEESLYFEGLEFIAEFIRGS